MDVNSLEKHILRKIADHTELNLSIEEIKKITLYVIHLSKWTKKANLVGIEDPKTIFDELIIDSIYLADFILKNFSKGKNYYNFKILDIGAGAGIPGIPFRILYKWGEYLMVEPRKKRGVFINLMVKLLDLKNTKVFFGNIEELKQKDFDLCLSRAFCKWDRFLKLSKNYLKQTGYVLIFSNSRWNVQKLTDFSFITQHSYVLPSKKERYFWLFSKKAPS